MTRVLDAVHPLLYKIKERKTEAFRSCVEKNFRKYERGNPAPKHCFYILIKQYFLKIVNASTKTSHAPVLKLILCLTTVQNNTRCRKDSA